MAVPSQWTAIYRDFERRRLTLSIRKVEPNARGPHRCSDGQIFQLTKRHWCVLDHYHFFWIPAWDWPNTARELLYRKFAGEGRGEDEEIEEGGKAAGHDEKRRELVSSNRQS